MTRAVAPFFTRARCCVKSFSSGDDVAIFARANCESVRRIHSPAENVTERDVTEPEWRHPFGIAFDIDGVLLRGRDPIGRSREALLGLFQKRQNSLIPKVPHVFLTNGGGGTEFSKAKELSEILKIPVLEEQVLLGHTPFKNFVQRFADKKVLAIGKNHPRDVMSHYGFKKVFSMENFVSQYPDIDPLEPYKPKINHFSSTHFLNSDKFQNFDKLENLEIKNLETQNFDKNEAVEAIFVLSDPVDWGRDIQVLCDVLRSGGVPGGREREGAQPELVWAADDFEYQAKFSVPRFGMGAFLLALKTLYEKLTGKTLKYSVIGKPYFSAFESAEKNIFSFAEKIRAAEKNIYFPSVDNLSLKEGSKPLFEENKTDNKKKKKMNEIKKERRENVLFSNSFTDSVQFNGSVKKKKKM